MFFNKFQEYTEEYYYKYPLILRKNMEFIFCTPECKRKNSSIIMGQFIVNKPRKPYIVIYYGSFEFLYRGYDDDFIKERLEEVIDHEVNHLIEYINGTNKTAHKEVIERSPGVKYKEIFLFLFFCIILIAVFYNIFEYMS